ncbi:MAG: YggS family pyridoxal phosphate-dependent enzyme [Thermoleophilia bacterium]|nr:YggS family pyridoxal phosphate-dependent enzyme [Thermoleophilia bacterium]
MNDPAEAARIRAGLDAVWSRIRAACEAAGRDPDEVRLLLATKTVEPEKIRVAIEAGATLVAENRVQEVRPKFEALDDLDYERHFIGHLQSNKINALVPYISCLQSLDRISLANKLQKRLEREDEQLDVLLQVNTSREESKFGLDPDNLEAFATEAGRLDRLRIRGLMTIGLFTDDQEKARPSLHRLRELRDQVRELNLDGVEMNELSMGMSGDLEVAIEEGATIVRVGTAVFGSRDTSGSDSRPGSPKT